MSSIREALFKQRHEGSRPHAGGGFYPAPPREREPRLWLYLIVGACLGGVLVAAAVWWLSIEDSPPAAVATAVMPTPVPTATPVPTVVVIAATPAADHTQQLLDEVARLREDMRALSQATPTPVPERPRYRPEPPRLTPSPATPSRATGRTPPFRLEGTMGSGGETAALIDGEVYRAGDVAHGYKIIAVGKNWVQCEGYPGYIEVSSEPAPASPEAPPPAR